MVFLGMDDGDISYGKEVRTVLFGGVIGLKVALYGIGS